MKKSDYIGWKDVFSFSLVQGMKQKAYFGFLIVVCVVLIFWLPVSSLINSKEEEAYTSEVTKLTVYDETGLGIDYSKALQEEAYAGVKVVTDSALTYDNHVKALEDSEEAEESTELVARIVFDEMGIFNITFVKAAGADLSDEDCDTLAGDFVAYFEDARISAIDVTSEQMEFINQSVETKVEFINETGEIIPQKEKKEGISMEEYMILLMGIMIVTMIVSLSGGSIATSIVTEKTTRVVEYLMINVRPMALIVGKILASLVMVAVQFAAMGISYGISFVLNTLLFGEQNMENLQNSTEGVEVSTVGFWKMLLGIEFVDVLIAVAVILAGIMFYSILAGLAGASVSKMEEMAEGLKIFQITMVVGSYMGIALCIVLMTGENPLFTNICCLVPISAPFVVPACLILNKIPLWIGLLGLAMILILVVCLFSFTAKVYESMIFYNGAAMKLKDILQIAKNRRAVERKEEKHE